MIVRRNMSAVVNPSAARRGAGPCSDRPDRNPSTSGVSASSAAGSCPRRWCPRSRSSKQEFRAAWASDEFRAELRALLSDYAGRPTPVTECRRLSERLGRARAAQARGPHPHRLAQDQQRARPGAPHAPDGQAPGDRRDRRRPARRGDRDRRRALRPRLHGVHGRGRRRAPGAQRVAHATARRRGRARSTRGARRSRTRSTTRSATGSRPWRPRTTASARSSGRIRTRGSSGSSSGSSATKRASSAGRSSAATIPTWSWRASAAGRTRSGRSPASSTPTRGSIGVEAARPRARERAARRVGDAGRARRAPRRPLAVPPGRGRPDPRGALDQRRARLSRRRPRARGARGGRPGRVPARRPTTRPSPGSSCSPRPRASCPALEPAHAIGWLAREAGHAIPAGSTVLVTLSGRGDKDAAQVAEMLGGLDRRHRRS